MYESNIIVKNKCMNKLFYVILIICIKFLQRMRHILLEHNNMKRLKKMVRPTIKASKSSYFFVFI